MLLRGAGRAVDPLTPMPEVVRDVLISAGWSHEPPAARGAARERWESMQALVALADDLATAAEAAGGRASLADLVAELDERASAQHAPTVEGVTLASLHAAKGLEWDAVFLAGLSDGLMPISLAETDEAVAEERRLLYVGITRARIHLELSFGRARNPGGRASRRRTRFLDGIWPTEPRATRHRSTAQRSLAESLTGEEAELFEQLRNWRSTVATETDKPAYTVLIDANLYQIPKTRPPPTPGPARAPGTG